MKFSKTQRYDPEKGKFVRDIKSTNIFLLDTGGALTGAAGTILATTTSDTNKDLFITHIAAGSRAVGGILVTVGNSTILPMTVPANDQTALEGTMDEPLYKADCTSAQTISIRAIDAGTYTAEIIGVYHPIHSKVETD